MALDSLSTVLHGRLPPDRAVRSEGENAWNALDPTTCFAVVTALVRCLDEPAAPNLLL